MKTRHYFVPLASGDCKAATTGRQQCLPHNASPDWRHRALSTVLLLAFVGGTQAATHYVDINSSNATPQPMERRGQHQRDGVKGGTTSTSSPSFRQKK